MAGVVKRATGLTGLGVSPHPIKTLNILYDRIQRVLQKMPEEAAYRRHTEKIVSERQQITKTERDWQKVEERLQCGQVEELILQADRELLLARKMLVWKPWQPLMGKATSNQWQWPPV